MMFAPPPPVHWDKFLQAFAFAFIASWVGTWLIRQYLLKKEILAHPNERSSHSLPTPQGGGIAVMLTLSTVWMFMHVQWWPHFFRFPCTVFIGFALSLAALSWLDDLYHLPPLSRLIVQIVVVGTTAFFYMPDSPHVLFGHPYSLFGQSPNTPLIWTLAIGGTFIVGLIWVWFINLFNFMDGIDGITGIEAVCLGSGIGLVSYLALINIPDSYMTELVYLGATVAAAALGFLVWNWHPAKIFLGDVGSVPLGFLLGGLLLQLGSSGFWVPALILPLYYLMDATITLIRRGLRGEKVWLAHREHYYQQAVQRGLKHSTVSLMVLVMNVILIDLAVWSLYQPIPAVIIAFVSTSIFLKILKGTGPKAEAQ